mmetsp:Transcript_6433/g.9476  ORF Transcript_6433/g.9476 Transcript_6433/m.9476 type:complete len:343 (+) Transcript_6433:133-1161(+)|eukprot:CAMPEP_0194216020 /NCGR_PEP_ID=MMETSP0156-20130528/18215_1 /TAXON_ID=33649 /ORGANISM="Thalassionema nitzschioides, Strain L26-B" /LENGTH=342 /DNA_ID=CAMNT_0038944685 /DNA_START=73 /DNA_END=1101 /DNA_ORIENTATION=+
MSGQTEPAENNEGGLSTSLQLPWVEKYRPKKLDDLVAHEDIISIITNLIESDNLPHLLFYGPPGTGKTSTIVAAAKKMFGGTAYSSMALELNASDARGIDVVRNEIKEFAGTRQLFDSGKIKLVVLDEADAMTNDAQFALRRIIEKYTKNTRFCLICNYVSKIIPALQSRCTRFRFAPLSREQIQGRLLEVAKLEKCKYTDDGIDAILRLSGGDMRRVLNLLQSTTMSASEVNESSVYLTSGSPLPSDMEIILDTLMNQSFQSAYEEILKLCTNNGYALVDVISDLTVMVSSLDNLPNEVMGRLLDGMSNVEYRLASGTDEKIQTASLVGVFVQTRELITFA